MLTLIGILVYEFDLAAPKRPHRILVSPIFPRHSCSVRNRRVHNDAASADWTYRYFWPLGVSQLMAEDDPLEMLARLGAEIRRHLPVAGALFSNCISQSSRLHRTSAGDRQPEVH